MQETGGYYVEPTIFDRVSPDMTIASEEIFGPVLSCIDFETEAEALAVANNSPYGLAAAVWTSDITRAHNMARKLRAGSVWVNYYDGGDMTAPFGGFKMSGYGRELGEEGLKAYTESKTVTIAL